MAERRHFSARSDRPRRHEGRTRNDRPQRPAREAVLELDRILNDEGDVKVVLGENQIFFDVGSTRLVSRLIEGEFPNYEQVIPKELKEKLDVRENFRKLKQEFDTWKRS